MFAHSRKAPNNLGALSTDQMDANEVFKQKKNKSTTFSSLV